MKAPLGRFELFVVLAAIIWGTSFVATKMGLASVDPLLFALLRYGFGSAVIMGMIFSLGRFDAKVFRDPLVILNAILSTVGFALQNIGMASTTATNSVLLININVGFVAILAAIILKEAISRQVIFGTVLGMVGVVAISTNGDLSALYSGTFVGNLLVFIAGIIWALYFVYQKMVLGRQKDVLMVTGAVILEATLMMVPVALLFSRSYAVDVNGWVAALYIGVICTGLANLLYNAGLRGLKASVSSVILLLEIVSAMVFAVLLLGEMPTGMTAAGGLLIILSIVVISLSNGRGRKARA